MSLISWMPENQGKKIGIGMSLWKCPRRKNRKIRSVRFCPNILRRMGKMKARIVLLKESKPECYKYSNLEMKNQSLINRQSKWRNIILRTCKNKNRIKGSNKYKRNQQLYKMNWTGSNDLFQYQFVFYSITLPVNI